MKKNDNIFWVSYADLMTSLFFVVLVLFVLTFLSLRKQQNEVEVENERLNRILKLEEQFKPLQQDESFLYLPDCKKYVAKELSGKEIFEPNKAQILQRFVRPTLETGKNLEKFLIELNKTNPDFAYLIVIEGNMANSWDGKFSKNSDYGFKISYERALSVYKLWQMHGIDLRKYNAEIMLCGSGFNGLCRDKIEENNKRFSIQIIPKIEYTKKNEN